MNIALLFAAEVVWLYPAIEPISPKIETKGPVSVEWILVDNVTSTCQEKLNKNDILVNACSQWTNDETERKCYIYTSKSNTTLSDIGQEIRHCFEGHFHK